MRVITTARRVLAVLMASAGVAALAVPAAVALPGTLSPGRAVAAAQAPVPTGRLASVMPRWRDLPSFGPRGNDDLPTVGRVTDVPELCLLRNVAGRASNSWGQWHANYGTGRNGQPATVFVVRIWQYGASRAPGAWSSAAAGVTGCSGAATRVVDGDTFRVVARSGRAGGGTFWATADVRQVAGGEQVRSLSYALWRKVGPAVIEVEAVRENAGMAVAVVSAAQRLLALTAARYQGVLS